ncbi:hypothetical protein H4R35_005484, partial [Dimargaris xerosporica]
MVAPPALYAECLTNLHIVNVHCALRSASNDHGYDSSSDHTMVFDRQQCRIHAENSNDSLPLPKPIAPPPMRIHPLPLPSSSDSVSTASQGVVFTFNVADKAAIDTSPTANTPVPLFLAEHAAPLPASRLSNVDQIYCRWCYQTVAQTVSSTNLMPASGHTQVLPSLTKGNTDQRVWFTGTNLPSEHWAELLDCWMCHPDEETKYIVQFDQDVSRPGARLYPWNPGQNQLLVGNTYALLHPSNIQARSVKVEPIANGHQDKNKFYDQHDVVTCRRCLSSLGECWRYQLMPTPNQEQASQDQDRVVYRLFMHAVAFADSHSP